MIELEPRLLALYTRALAIRKSGRPFDDLDVWIGHGGCEGMKAELVRLVGWSRKDSPELGTNQAYDLAYDKIYSEALCGEELEDF